MRCGEQNLLWKLAMDRSPVWHANEKHTDEGQSPCRRAETQKRKQKRLQCHANKIEIKKKYICLFVFFFVNQKFEVLTKITHAGRKTRRN